MRAAGKPRAVKLRHSIDVEVAAAPFVPFQSLRSLDLDRLRRSRHAVVELGQFEAGCCKRTVRAVVQRGRVTDVDVDPCSDGKKDGKTKATPEMARLMTQARKKLAGSTPPRPRLPMPVARFFARNDHGDIDLEVTAICMTMCAEFLGTKVCTVCCITFGTGGREQMSCASILYPF